MKLCTQCGLYMSQGFRGCPHCQTDEHIIIVEKYGDTTPKTTEVIPMGDCQPDESRFSQLKIREERKEEKK